MDSILASIVIIIIGVLYGIVLFKVLIPLLTRFKFGQSIRSEGPQSHLNKKGTPTMGGLVIILITIFLNVTLILFNYKDTNMNVYQIILLIIPFVSFGVIGFIDDYLIIVKKTNDGLKPHIKFLLQLLISAVCYYLTIQTRGTNEINFFGERIDLKFFYGIFIILSFTGFTNATNLTDGLDGLLGGTSAIITTGITVLAFINKNYYVMYFGLSLLTGIFAFLIFNLPKARIFMGDTGSLAIGAALFSMLLCLNMDVLIFIFGIIYLIETISVMLQVWFFKKTSGERLFKMSPFHHHLELSGLKDFQIDVIFWIITLICTIFACILGVRLF